MKALITKYGTSFLALFLIFLVGSCQGQSNPKIEIVESASFTQIIDSLGKAVQLIDVRTAGEYEAGHIEGARNLNINDGTFEKELNSLNPDLPILVYCQKGGRSARAAEICKAQGFKIIYDLKGGYADYP